MTDMLSAARSAIAVLFVGNLLIVCHELGHYLAARCFGVQARRFTVGFGPRLARLTDRRGTVWSLCLLPLGGCISLAGERDGAPSGYAAWPVLARMAIVIAGPAANLIIAVAVFAAMLAIFGQPAFLPVCDTVVAGSAAEQAGFQVGDRVMTMNAVPIAVFEDMRPGLRANPGRTVAFTVERGSTVVDLSARLGTIQDGGKTIGLLGIGSTTPSHQSLSGGQVLTGAVGKTWAALADSVTGIATVLTQGEGTENIAGVVGIAQLTGQAAEHGMAPLLALVAILSANLALMNLIPIPILDGGVLLFCVIELALRRPLSPRVQDVSTRTGLAVLASLFVMTTLHDLDGMGLFRWLAQQL